MEIKEYQTMPLDAFIVELSFEMSGASPGMLEHYVREAAIEFASRSRVFLREVELRLETCVPNYLVEPDDCVDICAIVGIKYFRCGRFDKYRFFDVCNCCTTCVPHRNITWNLPNTIIFDPPPMEDSKALLKCYVKPKRDACEIDMLFFTEYKDAVLHGARYRLYSIPNRAWTSRDASRIAQVEFERSIAAARTDKLMSGKVGPIRIKTIYNRC